METYEQDIESTNGEERVTCLAVGDPHFQVNNVPDAEDLIKKVNALVEQLQPTFVVILGDLLHTHERIHVTPFNLATRFVTSLARKVQVYLIIGNHDLQNNQQFLTSNHAFNSLKKIENVTVCDRVVLRKMNGMKFVFCPYVPPERFEEALATLEEKGRRWDDASCIFAHQEFFGCRFNPVMTSTDGDIWPEDYPLVVSGHIHNEQRLQSNIYYTGSSMQHAFGETANKTIALLTFEKDKPFQLQRIDLEMRKKKIVYLDVERADTFKPEPNTYIKLVLKGRPEQFKVFRRGQTYKDLQKMGLAISFAPQQDIVQADRTVQKKNVLEILEDMIKNDDDYVKAAFQELKRDD